jgi:cellulose synthase (UDP-forming)
MSAAPSAPARRRQWGSERNGTPLPTVHRRPSDRAIMWGRLAIIATVLAWLVYIIWTIVRQFIDRSVDFAFTAQAASYAVVVTLLTLSALTYLIARQGALERFRAHVRVPRAELDRHFDERRSSITVLVPSYAEETDVIRQTMWSAALQEFPSIRVVLLVDDPTHPTDEAVRARLDATRAIAGGIQLALAEPAARFAAAEQRFAAQGPSSWVSPSSVRELAGEYTWAAGWLDSMAAAEAVHDHVDRFFVDQVLCGLAADLDETAQALLSADADGEAPTHARMSELHRRLVWIFSADLTTFERKAYASLSHEANKAMNLNSYIGLMGGRYRFDETPKGTVLRRVEGDRFADLDIPDTEYLLTLDADSLLLRDYCVRLVHLLEQPENARVAVAQTPYSSYRGASSRIERLAGATTDLQHIQHQGMTRFGATFWVGANAVIRKVALMDIEETEQIGGFEVHRYVQDRTVIEDTESSIDLGLHGWTLVNYPERLSYSATPPDFGSLVVQRRRWANGGLLILPKLIRQIGERRRLGRVVAKAEVLLRVNYMASIAWSSFGLLFLLAFPYDSRLLSPFVLLAALPYFLAMGADLRSMRYRFSDLARIYGFNLILLPVNLAGVLKSLQQAITNKKIPFARTPKVRNRTAAPALYVIAPYLIIAFSLFTVWRNVEAQNWGNAAFAALNAVLATWATVSYIGIGASIVDVALAFRDWLLPLRKDGAASSAGGEVRVDWREVLYSGSAPGTPPTGQRPTRRDERIAA